MMNIPTKTEVKQQQSLSHPARRELKLSSNKVKNVSLRFTLMAAVA